MLYLTTKRILLEFMDIILRLMMPLSILICIGSIYADFWMASIHCWFQRSGSVLVLGGAAREVLYLVRDETLVSLQREHEQKAIANKYANNRKSGSVVYNEVARLNEKIEASSRLIENTDTSHLPSIILIIIGTLIWGYGDLIFKLILEFSV